MRPRASGEPSGDVVAPGPAPVHQVDLRREVHGGPELEGTRVRPHRSTSRTVPGLGSDRRRRPSDRCTGAARAQNKKYQKLTLQGHTDWVMCLQATDTMVRAWPTVPTARRSEAQLIYSAPSGPVRGRPTGRLWLLRRDDSSLGHGHAHLPSHPARTRRPALAGVRQGRSGVDRGRARRSREGAGWPLERTGSYVHRPLPAIRRRHGRVTDPRKPGGRAGQSS